MQIQTRLWVQVFHFDAVLLFMEVFLWRHCLGPHFPKSVSNNTVSIGKKQAVSYMKDNFFNMLTYLPDKFWAS